MISHWRQHWADRENKRREAEYNTDVLAWQQDLEQIRRFHRLSITAGPAINTSGIGLHHGENLWWTTSAASLVEMPGSVKLLAPDHSALIPAGGTIAPLPRGTLRDHGFIAITNHRVLFFGTAGTHDWRFSQLTGVVHGTREIVLGVANRKTLCGLGVAPALVAGFRFHLALALAEHIDDREGFTDYLARLLDRQQFHGPAVPSPAGPGDAPHPLRWALWLGRRLYFGQPGASAARQVVPALATAILLACGLGLAAVPNIDRQAGASGDWLAPNHPDPSHPVVSPTPLGTPVDMPVGPLGPEAPSKQTPPQKGTSGIEAPATKPEEAAPSSAPPTAGNLCGAPANPWNYTFCAAGSLIADPPAAFCTYFSCADNFWHNAGGFVVQCQDGLFSQTGGRPGACLHHGGVKRQLRQAV